MGVEENKAAVRRFVDEGLNNKNIDGIMAELCTPDCTLEAPGVPTAAGHANGYQIFRDAVYNWTDAFPDVQVRLEHLLVDGDTVSFDLPNDGTHKKEFAGVPPTNEKSHGAELWFVECENGKFKHVRICEYGTPLRAALIAAQAHGAHP